MNEYIDATPKWVVWKVLVYCAMDQNSSEEAKTVAWAELRKMAAISDLHIEKMTDDKNVLEASLLPVSIRSGPEDTFEKEKEDDND